jgi:hypothetical protein
MKKNCELCGDEAYREVETPDAGAVTMCKGCFDSYDSFCHA